MKRQGALAGVKVLDLTQMLAGPYATMLLADQGADVLKIEPPSGDIARGIGPFHPQDPDRAYGGYFQSINRNKRSLVLDLKTVQDRQHFLALAEEADMVVENFRTGVMERLGLSYEELRKRNPRLVYGSLRGFGDPRGGASPYADWPALDVVAQAMGGMMGITGPDAATPLKTGPGVGDTIPALFLGFGLMCALLRARETGAGQYVDVSMVDCIFSICERIGHQYSYSGVIPRPEGNRHPLLCPFGPVPAADGWITVACPADGFWHQLCRLLGLEHAASDPRFASNEKRVENAEAVYSLIGEQTRLLTKVELRSLLGGHVPFGPVYSAADIFADEHFRQRSMLVELEHPGATEPVTVAGSAVKLPDIERLAMTRAPLLNEHGDAVKAALAAKASLQKDDLQPL